MRAVSLSQPGILDLLNAHYVPVSLDFYDYEGGRVPAEEQRLFDELELQLAARGVDLDQVNRYLAKDPFCNDAPVYTKRGRAFLPAFYALVVDGRGQVLDYLGEELEQPHVLGPFLRDTAAELGVPAGPPVARGLAHPPPELQPGQVLLSAVSRVPRRAAPAMKLEWLFLENIEEAMGSEDFAARPFAAQDTVLLGAEDVDMLAPPTRLVPGGSWTVPPPLASRLFVPLLPALDSHLVQVEEARLEARVLSVDPEGALVWLEGSTRIRQPLYNVTLLAGDFEARVEGVMRCRTEGPRLQSFELATREASFRTLEGRQVPVAAAVTLR